VPQSVIRADRVAARERFRLDRGESCLLVIGGSLGAFSINEAAFEAFGESSAGQANALDGGRLRVIHVAGRRDYPELRARHERAGSPDHYTLIEYEPGLGEVLAASDLVLARAGGSIFEIAAAGRPAVLVPYPRATADHQTMNARWMGEVGAAVVLPDRELSPQRLIELARELLGDSGRLERMAAASRSFARPDAAKRIAGEVLSAALSAGGGAGARGEEGAA
jgi:UDP-N-acetylglucosamine--N-acetylmuramyl-(pentapeptide) pyrophosphoryl-undecaprenol N-acetylglucosamine transferase